MGYSKFGSSIASKIRKKELHNHFTIDNGVSIFLDYTNPLTWELILGKDMEKNVKDVFLKNLSIGDTVIDVGAHIGEYSIIASQKIGSNGHVISIEPLSDAVNWLKKNTSINNFSSYSLIESAVGGENGKSILYRNSKGGTFGYLEPMVDGISLEKHGLVDVTTIDTILQNRNITNVDMLKIDVEGFEYEVLMGCLESFKRNKIQKIICEIHLDFLKKKDFDEKMIYSLLLENGFTLKIIEKIKSKKTLHILAILSEELTP